MGGGKVCTRMLCARTVDCCTRRIPTVLPVLYGTAFLVYSRLRTVYYCLRLMVTREWRIALTFGHTSGLYDSYIIEDAVLLPAYRPTVWFPIRYFLCPLLLVHGF